ncbi:hypothetical protein J1N35_029277 [Gossypium stocksii]|uniref:Uncharacterized protein n=1 Tax=Gossypium stocksii TaxID=47602 RepID=A0A9D3UXG9_9ROSI|nr:hypothetical protein J1N35_029277 [Gossypium stocksii]
MIVSWVSSHIDDAESSLSTHTTPDQALDMDITTLLGEAHAKERATTAAPLMKSVTKKNQKNPKVEESTQEIEESEHLQLKRGRIRKGLPTLETPTYPIPTLPVVLVESVHSTDSSICHIDPPLVEVPTKSLCVNNPKQSTPK